MTSPPADAEEGLRPLAEAIAALTTVPSARELAGEPGARAVYHAGFRRPAQGGSGRLRRTRLLASLLSVKLAAAAAVAAGGLTAAAYADVLPAPVQSFAHRTLRAPAPHPEPGPGRPAARSGQAPASRAAQGQPCGHPSGQAVPGVLAYPGGRRRHARQSPRPRAAPQSSQPSQPPAASQPPGRPGTSGCMSPGPWTCGQGPDSPGADAPAAR